MLNDIPRPNDEFIFTKQYIKHTKISNNPIRIIPKNTKGKILTTHITLGKTPLEEYQVQYTTTTSCPNTIYYDSFGPEIFYYVNFIDKPHLNKSFNL